MLQFFLWNYSICFSFIYFFTFFFHREIIIMSHNESMAAFLLRKTKILASETGFCNFYNFREKNSFDNNILVREYVKIFFLFSFQFVYISTNCNPILYSLMNLVFFFTSSLTLMKYCKSATYNLWLLVYFR